MTIETSSERRVRLQREAALTGTVVPGRALPIGYQWNGTEVAGRGQAAARRLRQLARQAQRLSARSTVTAVVVPAPE